MFFDEPDNRNPKAKSNVRLAAVPRAPEPSWLDQVNAVDENAAKRHREARARREAQRNALLDQAEDIALLRREQEASREREFVRDQESRHEHKANVSQKAKVAPTQNYSQPDAPRNEPHSYHNQDQSFSQDAQLRDELNVSASNERDGPLVDPAYVFRAIRKWRALIAATTILGGVLGIMTALNTPHLYYSAAEVLVDPRNFKVIENDLNPDVFLSEASLAIVDSQVSLMRSPLVIERVVKELGLENDPEFNGTLHQGALGSLISLLSGKSVVKDGAVSAARYLSEHMSVDRGPKTFVVSIGTFSEEPQKSALIANKIVDIYLSEQAKYRSDTASRTSGELTSRLSDLKKQVSSAETKVEKYKTENGLVGVEGRMIGDEELLRLNDQLAAARSTTISLRARAQTAKSATVELVAAGGLPEEIASSALTAMRSQVASAKQRLDGLQAKLGPKHPDIQQAAQEYDSVRGEIANEIKRIRSSLQTDLQRAEQTEQGLATRLGQLKAGQGVSGEAMVKLRELDREANTARAVYEQFLLRARETGELGTINSTNVQQISTAKAADVPEGSSRKILAIGGFIGGLILGLGLAIMKGIYDALQSQFEGGRSASQRPVHSGPFSPPQGGRTKRRLGMFSPKEVVADSHLTSPSQHFAPQARHDVSPHQAPSFAPQSQYFAAPQQFAPQFDAQVYAPPAPQPVYAQPQPSPFVPQQVPAQPYAYAPQPSPQMMPQQVYMPQFVPQPLYAQQQYAPAPQMVWQPQPMPQPHFVPAPQPVQHHVQPAPAPVPQQPQPTQFTPLPAQPEVADIARSLDEFRAAVIDLAKIRRSA